MSEKQVKKYKRVFKRYQNKIWRSAYETVLGTIPKKRGLKRIIFCLKLVFQKDIANFIQQQFSGSASLHPNADKPTSHSRKRCRK